MAAPAHSLSTLLNSTTSCLSSIESSLPKTTKDAPSDVTIEPPPDGISLLDTKSEILLSYLHNLVFLIIIQLRQLSSNGQAEADSISSLRADIVKKLVELRVFLDRGVRPLEGRLKYQVDKVVKAAEDAERETQSNKEVSSRKLTGSHSDPGSSDEEDASGNDGDSQDESDEEEIDEMAYRPNLSAFTKGVAERQQAKPDRSVKQAPSDGIYRPPKIMPTALPTTERREREDRRPRRSNVIDEFVSAEMSSAPMAEPSIGSTILAGGRQTKSKKDREHEAERTAYEETNFVRFPKETKKELSKRRGHGRDSTFGGDEWKGLTEGADRIESLTRRVKGSGAVLEKSRKRKTNEDGQRGDGTAMGQVFDKRRKKMESWKR